ncbi:hypothetical protein KQY27_00180 [Methanobrevibacter sp. TMH8]|uniref:hypothetical protein n=1 Tax=Methanobrevibacter sp. TMH8 TaxID=2848611 RepID=UPI001CCAC1BA|nr:hypothetical protein [Methanobrevibacter sp. TMH8]MBZ9569975.1 hypothetical protein [Methanobrevibacter sp. TMH8]
MNNIITNIITNKFFITFVFILIGSIITFYASKEIFNKYELKRNVNNFDTVYRNLVISSLIITYITSIIFIIFRSEIPSILDAIFILFSSTFVFTLQLYFKIFNKHQEKILLKKEKEKEYSERQESLEKYIITYLEDIALEFKINCWSCNPRNELCLKCRPIAKPNPFIHQYILKHNFESDNYVDFFHLERTIKTINYMIEDYNERPCTEKLKITLFGIFAYNSFLTYGMIDNGLKKLDSPHLDKLDGNKDSDEIFYIIMKYPNYRDFFMWQNEVHGIADPYLDKFK